MPVLCGIIRQAEQCFGSAPKRAFEVRSAHLDMRDPALVDVGEPRAVLVAFADDIRSGCGLQDGGRQTAPVGKISPDPGSAPQRWFLRPALRDHHGRLGSPLAVEMVGKIRRHPDEPAQSVADLAKAHSGAQGTNQVENVALCFALRIPPATPVVVDAQDFSLRAAVFSARRVLSRRSRRHEGDQFSSSTAQLISVRNRSSSTSSLDMFRCLQAGRHTDARLASAPRRRAAVGRPAKGARGKGAEGSREAASLAARPAQAAAICSCLSGRHLAWLPPARANGDRRSGPREGHNPNCPGVSPRNAQPTRV